MHEAVQPYQARVLDESERIESDVPGLAAAFDARAPLKFDFSFDVAPVLKFARPYAGLRASLPIFLLRSTWRRCPS